MPVFLPVRRSHSRTPDSGTPPERALPCAANATLHTWSSWPSMQWSSRPVVVSHRRTVLSSPAESARLPQGDRTDPTMRAVCPLNTRRHLPVSASHSRNVLSALLVNTRLPSPDTDTDQTVS